ncbi:MAG TPA: DUF1178 family protein [Casimicrobiaceae bacterium]|nr:DUF1178 family protein [Casimicrobiaceae bacterium]
MIVYDLACAHGHAFEGWFASADAFAEQKSRSLVRCPVCDVADVDRRPSARVSVPRGTTAVPPEAPAPAPPAAPAQEAIAGLPAELIGKLREIVRNTENVGRRFPEEARKIHYDEVPARAIRGQASHEEAQALRDEGIEFSSLPPVLTSDTH